MAKKRKASAKGKSPRRYSRFKRRKSKTVPLEMLIGATSIPFVEPASGVASPFYSAQRGDYWAIPHEIVRGFTGINTIMGTPPDIIKTLNPLDFSEARYWKILFWTGLFGMIRKRFVRNSSVLIRKIPFIGRFVS